ncbi:hypothetical protein M409DRAFT_66806 [Zasmidium cellare ATCC 36951]|uniref:PH domain-containing protein n=1 Tax=Zasmidium cellare ATCC 36951 TaxID=1080233 RepID=A0A6A6CGP8_ZASCE|nr:uncharacterized protein M409DRAFT_66806 [Zasmidium cellare ATCC 36951]KAF2166364.1 hypothetical protein M409DRAFT_66806 [Zasmidium cellare ATCC 36951]
MAESGSPPRPSRYKSQRQKQPSVDDMRSSDQYTSLPEEDGIARSKSRYRRKQGLSDPPTDAARPASKQQNDIPSRYHSKHRESPLKPLYQEQIVQAPAQHRRTTANPKRKDDGYGPPPAELGAREPRSFTSDEPSSGAEDLRQQNSNNRDSSNRRNGEPRSASNLPKATPPASEPTGELFPPPKPVEPPVSKDGPPQSGNIRATKSTSHLSAYNDDAEAGCFGGLFKRKRGDVQAPDVQKAPSAPARGNRGEPPTIKPGGGGIVPGTDAPVSAINAGDRHVLVECGKARALFPVTPSTSPTDIIKSAATCLSERIDAKSAVLLEHFGIVGVQRPLRRYEHVRDVMNSWDHDKQNSLLLVDPGTGSLEAELTLAGVPKTEPEEQSWYLSYSQKVGKWEKKFITLRTSGQIVCQKDPDKPKDTVNVCHLSDFDIYTPTQEKLKKKIKPPKKYCCAIKSQQKTSLFEATENFVHFFSTADRQTSDDFYNAVQAWRSYYLVNVLGAGKKEKAKPVVSSNEPRDRSTSNDQIKAHRPQESMESHYQLGSFKPLMDMGQFDRGATSQAVDNSRPESSGGFAKSANQFDVNVSPERRTSTRRKQAPPPLSLNNRVQLAEDEPLANLNRSGSVNKRRSSTEQKRPEAQDFKDSGLLGRKYSQRRKENADRESQRQDAFTAGPNLLNGGLSPREGEFGQTLAGDGLRRQPSARGHTSSGELRHSKSTRDSGCGHTRGGSIDLERSGSRRQKPKPLVDLTPQFREPPQYQSSKKGKGFNPTTLAPGGLIENATTPEDPLGLPVATIFRNTSGQHSNPNSPGLIDLTPQHREPIHHTRKGRGFQPDAPNTSGLVGNATSPEDPLGLPQNNVFRSVNAMPEGRRRAGSVTDASPPVQRRLSAPRAPDAFTGEGLLAASQNRQGWGGSTKGRGVIDGSRANGKPLVDLTADSRFVQGSLLNKVEKAGGIPAPIMDREKRDERSEKYGEGY